MIKNSCKCPIKMEILVTFVAPWQGALVMFKLDIPIPFTLGKTLGHWALTGNYLNKMFESIIIMKLFQNLNIRQNSKLNGLHDLLSRYQDLPSWYQDLPSRYQDLPTRYQDLPSRWDLNLRRTAQKARIYRPLCYSNS